MPKHHINVVFISETISNYWAVTITFHEENSKFYLNVLLFQW